MGQDLPESFTIICINCRKRLYTYSGTFDGEFDPSSFVPVTADVPPPRPRDVMACIKCHQAWYMLRFGGGIVVATDKGFRPRDPDGVRSAPFPGVGGLTVDTPPEFVGTKPDFKDPLDQKKG